MSFNIYNSNFKKSIHIQENDPNILNYAHRVYQDIL